jgi:hypothetical protein
LAGNSEGSRRNMPRPSDVPLGMSLGYSSPFISSSLNLYRVLNLLIGKALVVGLLLGRALGLIGYPLDPLLDILGLLLRSLY